MLLLPFLAMILAFCKDTSTGLLGHHSPISFECNKHILFDPFLLGFALLHTFSSLLGKTLDFIDIVLNLSSGGYQNNLIFLSLYFQGARFILDSSVFPVTHSDYHLSNLLQLMGKGREEQW